MAVMNIEHDILKDAIQELEETKKLVIHDCKAAANQKIDFAIAALRAKIEGQRFLKT